MDIILAFLLGAACGIFCTSLARSSKAADAAFDDYYDHDVSGLLEED